MTTLVMESLGLVLLFVCSAFFSSAETALFSLNRIQIRRLGRTRPAAAEKIDSMLSAPTQLLSTILIGNTLVNVTAAGLGYAVANTLFASHGVAVAIPAMTIFLLLFGEVTPKRVAMAHPEKLASLYAAPLAFLIRLFVPLRALLEVVSSLFEKHLTADKQLTEDEFRTVVEVGEEEGVLDEEERTMVDGIIRLEETQASNVMTPRVDLVGVDLDDPLEEALATARSVNFRYLPLYRETLDHAEGFLDVPRFLLSREHDLEAARIPPFFVPETAPLDALLSTLQQENRRVAFVVDEFGGTAGLITRGDILEEIVSDVDNEYGREKVMIQPAGSDTWLVDGSTSLDDINYELDMDLEAEGADRIAGWVTAQAKRIPRSGDVVEAQRCRARVQRIRRNRIIVVQLEKLAREESENGEERTD